MCVCLIDIFACLLGVAECVVGIHRVERECAVVFGLHIASCLCVHCHCEWEHQRYPLLCFIVVERHLSLVYHLVGSIESDAVRSEERLLVYQFDIVFRHEIVTGEGFRHYVLQVGCHTLRHIEQCVVAELCLKVGESSPCRIRITEKQRVDVAGIEIEDVLGVYRSVLLLGFDVLINLVDNLLCVYISLTCCDRLVVGVFQRYLHAYVIVCVISVWHYGVVVHLGISQLRHIVYCSQLEVC